MKTFTIPYKLSKDYKKLFELVNAGNRMVCFVDYRYTGMKGQPLRDICTIRNNNYEASSRGNGYFGFIDANGTEEDILVDFLENCELTNLEWIVPTE